MKILFVHPALSNQGGAQLAYYWLVNGLADRGHSIVYATSHDPKGISSDLSVKGITVELLEQNEEIQTIVKLSQNADVVITGNYPATLWVGLAKKETTHFPPVFCHATEPPRQLYEDELSPHFRGSSLDPKFYFPWSRALTRKRMSGEIKLDQLTVKSFDRVIAIGDYAGTLFQKVYHCPVDVIPLGVGDWQSESPLFPEDPFTFLAPAGLEPVKNFETTIKGFARFVKQADARLILTGDGFWRKKAEALVRRYRIEGKVSFAGWVLREDLKKYYRNCHAVIYVPIDEPFGLVACEAGLLGKPVIVSNHGGPAEIVQDGITGFHVNPFYDKALSMKMKSLYHDRRLAAGLGGAGQKRISMFFNHQSYLSKFEGFLK